MIVDVHVHFGWDFTFDEDFSRQELIEKMEKHHVDVQIVQPGTCHSLEQVREQHDAIAVLCREFPKRFFGMANPSPHLPDAIYHSEVKRCVEELGFIGLKLHPMASGVNPNSKAGRKAFAAAAKYGIPLMVHTGAGVPFAGPINLLAMAKEYSQLKIIMAHCGQIIFANEAAAVFSACPNVFGDTSWSPGFFIRNWCRNFGPRLMLGSDHADNIGTELAKTRTVGMTAEEQEAVLGKTAVEVFKLEEKL